jgi:hypothetical protein
MHATVHIFMPPLVFCPALLPYQVHELSPGYQRYLAMLQGGTLKCRMCATSLILMPPLVFCPALLPYQVHELSPGYQQYLAMLQGGTNECRMCAHIVQRRLTGDFSRATTCLWNQTWLQQAGQQFKNFSCPGDV